MAGPFPPYPPVGAQGPYPYPDNLGGPGTQGLGPYPGPLPPPIGYPPPATRPAGRSRALWWAAAALATVAGLVVAALAIGGGRSESTAFTGPAAKAAIQGYLDALSDNDTEVIATNNACGMFDAIKDRKSDLALARLASDAFRKQFTRAEVTGIDKIVLSSPYQAQVLFTMKVSPASGTRVARDDQQGVAQLLRQDNTMLVCSYLLRTAAQY